MALNENLILQALSAGLKTESVQMIISTLGEYTKTEHEYNGTMVYHFQTQPVAIYFDDNDLLTKIEIISKESSNLVLQNIIEKYPNQNAIIQHLGQPNVHQSNTQLLVYNLTTYWIRFEFEKEITIKIVYLSPSCVGLGYKNEDKILRTCKRSGKP